MPITPQDLPGLYDGLVLSASGERIGSVGRIYVDDQTGEPTFVATTTGLFGASQTFVPLRGARAENGNVVVDFDRTTVKDAPRMPDDGSLTPAEEDRLYAYYGLSGGEADAVDYGVADQVPVPGSAHAGGPLPAGPPPGYAAPAVEPPGTGTTPEDAGGPGKDGAAPERPTAGWRAPGERDV